MSPKSKPAFFSLISADFLQLPVAMAILQSGFRARYFMKVVAPGTGRMGHLAICPSSEAKNRARTLFKCSEETSPKCLSRISEATPVSVEYR